MLFRRVFSRCLEFIIICRNKNINLEYKEMTSVLSTIAQRPTRSNFTVTYHNAGGDVFLQTDLDSWVSNNSSDITQQGSYYIVNDPSQFRSITTNLNHDLGSNYLNNYVGHSLKDLGKEVCIGNPLEPRILVLRLVSIPPSSSTVPIPSQVGYVVVENNALDITRPRFSVVVART